MISICDNCQYSKSDCKGNKSPEKIKCEHYKKPVVFNAKEAAGRIAELEAINKELLASNEVWRRAAYSQEDIEELAKHCYFIGELGASINEDWASDVAYKIREYVTSLFVKNGGRT